jgi:hypothetical protein
MDKKLIIGLALILISIILLSFKIASFESFKIYEPDCVLKNITDTCSPKQVALMFYRNETINAEDLNLSYLNENCKNLSSSDDTWSCNKYLIKYE